MINLVLDTLIPGDNELGMPPASEVDFAAYQLKYKAQQVVGDFLAELTTIALSTFGMEFTYLDEGQRLAAVNACKLKNIRLFSAFLTHCFRAYYSEKAILNRLSVGSVPPFPVGNTIEQNDWGLLEPVYERGPIYRTVHET